jgi:hypothetical protein
MRFLIGCYEICGLIKTYSEELRKQGHSVTTISDKNAFFDYSYNYSLTNLKYNYFDKNIKSGYLKKLFFKSSELIEIVFPQFRSYLIFFLLARKTDVYIYIWDGFLPDKQFFRLLDLFKIKIIVLFLGDDVRNFTAFSQEFDVSKWQFPESYSKKPISESIFKLRYAEKYADVIYSVPDQMGFAVRPYYHIHIPIYTSDYYFKNNFRKTPLILHLPSEPFIKGSDVIMKTLEELRSEGLNFEVIYKSKIPHEEVKLVLADVDILVDELILHGPGVLSFEAIASGCAVATNYLEEYSQLFDPPICSITSSTIKDKLRELIINYDYRQDLINKGYDYVVKNNDPKKIVTAILDNISGVETEGKYVPKFYKDKFKKPAEFAKVFEQADEIYKY